MQVPGSAIVLLMAAAASASAAEPNARGNAADGLPPPEADAVWAHLQQQDYRESWSLWPGTSELYEGTEPHGALLSTYVNATTQAALRDGDVPLPRGSLIVKENYKPPEQLMAVTVMYKAKAGYDPEHNDWFWLKRLADGTVEASGKVESCQSCHAVSDNDYLRTPLPEE